MKLPAIGPCVVIACTLLCGACTTRRTLPVTPPTGDSTAVGKVYVTLTDGSHAVLQSAYFRSDSIIGLERLADARIARHRRAVALKDVRTVEQERGDAKKTLPILAGAVLLVFLMAQGLSGMTPSGTGY